MVDILIVGKGPAGIQAAIYAKRAGMDVLVVGKGYGSLAKAEKIENYFGHEETHTGAELLEKGWRQAEALGIPIVTDEVVGMQFEGIARVVTTKTEYEARAVILATGNTRQRPNIERLAEFEGHGVSYCAVCDAFFYRGKTVGVLGSGSYAAHEADILKDVAGQVTIFTDGRDFTEQAPEKVGVDTRKILRVSGTETLEEVHFVDGGSLALHGLFVAIGTAGAAAFARKLGVETDGNSIRVDENMATAIPGVFAAGDCTGGILQISHAVAEGTTAALRAIAYVKEERKKAAAEVQAP